MKADQKMGLPARIRKKLEESEIEAIRGRIQWMRHKRQNGTWKSRHKYQTQEEALAMFESKLIRQQERKEARHALEDAAGMFFSGSGVRTKKRVRDHVGIKTGSYIHVVRSGNATVVVKSRRMS